MSFSVSVAFAFGLWPVQGGIKGQDFTFAGDDYDDDF